MGMGILQRWYIYIYIYVVYMYTIGCLMDKVKNKYRNTVMAKGLVYGSLRLASNLEASRPFPDQDPPPFASTVHYTLSMVIDTVH